MEKFINRRAAGKILAHYLSHYKKHTNVLVLALPRGGVPVAYEVARELHVPLDVFVVRKLGVPGHEELAMGAIASGGVTVFNEAIVNELAIPKKLLAQAIADEQKEIVRREKLYRGNRPFPALKNKTIILIDDGIATGATLRAAIQALRQQQVRTIIAAVPVAALDTCQEITPLVDELVCPLQPRFFNAVGAWYEDFAQTADEEVIELLKE